MNSDLCETEEDPLIGVRAKTSPPLASRSGQFPGVRRFKRSRWARVLGDEKRANCYHVMSRLTDGLEFFDQTEKEALALLIWKMAAFCKVKVLTYCVMGNHFHVLIEVPPAEEERAFFRETKVVDGEDEELGWTRLYRHLGTLYSKAYVAELQAEVAKFRAVGNLEQVEEIREAFLGRIADLSNYVREVKERFTRWCNKHRGRRGGLWQGRFKSVIVQGDENSKDHDSGYTNALRTMAAYIDLNPVRAGLVEDPADYPWCGYAAAMKGSKRARIGLARVMGQRVYAWEKDQVGLRYLELLRRNGLEQGVAGAKAKAGTEKTELPEGPKLDMSKESISSLTRGLALGTKEFIEDVFERNRSAFGPKRQRGRKPSGLKRLFALRQIKRDGS